MRLYIAGKITGLDEAEAMRLFCDAGNDLYIRGHEPLNPMELVEQTPGRSYMAYLIDALRIIDTQAEGLYMLRNWTDSFGARIEHELAVHNKLPIFYQASELPEAN